MRKNGSERLGNFPKVAHSRTVEPGSGPQRTDAEDLTLSYFTASLPCCLHSPYLSSVVTSVSNLSELWPYSEHIYLLRLNMLHFCCYK